MSEPAGDETGHPEEAVLDDIITAEMDDAMAGVFRRRRRAEEARYREAHPGEGLRERKRRLTRSLISDAATALFASRGFDAVKVSEIAERVGVSEKTIYNYFPNKESMVLDSADELVEGLASALRTRPPGTSITDAVVRALEADSSDLDAMDDDLAEFVPRLVAMIEQTPTLHAHWLEVHDRLARVAIEELAAQAGVDPRDPEPIVAGHALVGLVNVDMEAQVRHITAGLRGPELRAAVVTDVRRAARLLDTGLWAFSLPLTERSRRQAAEAMRAAEDVRRQVVSALREARAAWEQARGTVREDARRAATTDPHRGQTGGRRGSG